MPIASDLAARLEVPRDPEELRMYGLSVESKSLSVSEIESQLAAYERQDLHTTRAFIVATLVWPDGRTTQHPQGRFIGTARLHSIDWSDRKARLAIGIYDRRFWSHGLGTEAIRLLLQYGFDQLNLNRVELRVLEFNSRAIRSYEKCGFFREGIERDSAFVDGRWENDVVMAILKADYLQQPWTGADAPP
jgi:[ribosomal protein S5]-alanine N-acetyltransferase